MGNNCPVLDEATIEAVAKKILEIQKEAEAAKQPKRFQMSIDNNYPSVSTNGYLTTSNGTNFTILYKGNAHYITVFKEKTSGELVVGFSFATGAMPVSEWKNFMKFIDDVTTYIKKLQASKV